MTKKILLSAFVFLLSTPLMYAQTYTDFSNGYKAGYKAGYCKGVSYCVCVPPVAPVLPGRYTYQDGYNAGFTRGQSESPYTTSSRASSSSSAPSKLTNFTRGYKEGYQAGYCQNQVGCIASLYSYNIPYPSGYESSSSYQDGYNRGFKEGQQKSPYTNGSQSSGTQPVIIYDPNAVARAAQERKELAMREEELRMKQQRARQDALDKQIQGMKEKALAQLARTKEYYASHTSYPDKIVNGWHNVMVTNNHDLFSEAKAYVASNIITSLVLESWDQKKLSSSIPIVKAKTIVQANSSDNTGSELLDVYFLESITRPNDTTTPPAGPGGFCFWTDWGQASKIKIYIENCKIPGQSIQLANLRKRKYMSARSIKNNNISGTITYLYKPGTYHYEISFAGYYRTKTWKGTFTIKAGQWTMVKITRSKVYFRYEY